MLRSFSKKFDLIYQKELPKNPNIYFQRSKNIGTKPLQTGML